MRLHDHRWVGVMIRGAREIANQQLENMVASIHDLPLLLFDASILKLAQMNDARGYCRSYRWTGLQLCPLFDVWRRRAESCTLQV